MPEPTISKGQLWTGRVLSGLAALFLLFDGTMKLVKPAEVIKATVDLGYPEAVITGIGLALLFSTIVYLIPRTSFYGAILLTGYLGGADATHVRVQQPVFNIVFPIIFGVMVWAGLVLRDVRLRKLL